MPIYIDDRLAPTSINKIYRASHHLAFNPNPRPLAINPAATPAKQSTQRVSQRANHKMSRSSSSSGVKKVENMKDLRSCLKLAGSDNLVVLEFMAPWSEPSKSMEQPYKEVASSPVFSDKNVQFLQLNFDKFQDMGRALRVEAMPTFLLVKDWRIEDRIVALSKRELSGRIENFLRANN